MPIIFAGKTAFNILRILRSQKFPFQIENRDFSNMEPFRSKSAASSLSTIADFCMPSMDKIEIMVPKMSGHSHLNFWQLRECSPMNMKSRFIKVNDSVYLPNPETLLVQLSRTFSKELLYLAAMEMCGSFAIDIANKTFVSNLDPVTSFKDITKKLKHIQVSMV